MKQAGKWILVGTGVVAGLALLAILIVFAISQTMLGREYEAAAEALPRPTAAQLADAPRQARVLGCHGCHGERLRGELMVDIPNVARLHAPNLTAIAARATDQQLAAAVRQGIGTDKRPLYVMPSPMYARLEGQAVAALIAYIRGLPVQPGREEGVRVGPLGRLGLVTGRFRSAPATMDEFRSQAPIDLGPAHASARRLIMVNCTECHGPALHGQPLIESGAAPDLAIAAGYDLAQFTTLLRTGKAPHGRDLGLMAEVARDDLKYYTDVEIAAIHAYLVARAARLAQ